MAQPAQDQQTALETVRIPRAALSGGLPDGDPQVMEETAGYAEAGGTDAYLLPAAALLACLFARERLEEPGRDSGLPQNKGANVT